MRTLARSVISRNWDPVTVLAAPRKWISMRPYCHLAAESVCGFAAGGRAFRPQARSGVTGALAVGRRLVAGCLERPLGSGLAGPLVVSLLKAAASRLNPPDSSGLP